MTHVTNVLAVHATGAGQVMDEAVSVGLVLGGPTDDPPSDRMTVWGDCMGAAYPGVARRPRLFRSAHGLSVIHRSVAPILNGREITTFREMAAEIDTLTEEARVLASENEERDASPELAEDTREGLSRRDLLTAPFRALRPEPPQARPAYVRVERPIHPAIRYGVSQALLKAAALTRKKTMAAVIADEWNLAPPGRLVPIHAHTGPDPRRDAERMIARRVDSLAHAVAEDTEKDLGKDGEHLVRYVRWLRDRIAALGGPDYRPVIHLDVRGALGHIYDNNLGRILGYLYRLESSVQPYALRLQDPVTMESRAAQIDTMRTLRKYIRFREMSVEIVVDQWANSPDDVQAFAAAEAADMIYIRMPELGSVGNAAETVLACKQSGVGAVLGGSSTETDLAARVAAHVALATQPDLVLARPGIDVDTAVSTTRNEMARALVLIEAHSQ